MIAPLAVLALFVCILSIFMPQLRPFAKAIGITAAVLVGGFTLLVLVVSH